MSWTNNLRDSHIKWMSCKCMWLCCNAIEVFVRREEKARQTWGGKAIISKIATVIGQVRPEASL